MVKCFFIEATEKVEVYLRRYSPSDKNKCVGEHGYGYHDAMILVGEEKAAYETREYNNFQGTVIVNPVKDWEKKFPRSHDRWPTECDWCKYQFESDDAWQIFTELIYQSDSGELMGLRNLPEGAMYYGWWEKENPRYSPTGPLYAVCPGGYPWNIDGRASNCTMPNDNDHRCWIRHGELPNITVDKNGLTCAAGAGSIQAGKYHGFLRDGVFT